MPQKKKSTSKKNTKKEVSKMIKMDEKKWNKLAKDEKMYGMLTHLSALIGFLFPLGNLVGPFIFWILKRNESKFVDECGKDALNFQISICIYTIGAGILCLILIGFLILPVITVVNLILILIASIKANDGISFKYPLSIQFIK